MDDNEEKAVANHPQVDASMTEAEWAADFKKRFENALKAVCDLQDEAKRSGFQASWVGVGQDMFGKTVPVGVQLCKFF